MNYFLVDYENVNVSGLNGISNLTENDIVIIFYSENAETLTFGMHKRINESKAEIQFQKVAVNEKNALDFQLCTYLGYLIRDKINEENVENNYYIVSNDNGYSVLTNYCKRYKAVLNIVSNLLKDEVQKTEIKLSPQDDKVSELEKILSKNLNDKNEIVEVKRIINISKTKVEVNNNLCKKFNSQKGGEIYRMIKPFLKDKKSD